METMTRGNDEGKCRRRGRERNKRRKMKRGTANLIRTGIREIKKKKGQYRKKIGTKKTEKMKEI